MIRMRGTTHENLEAIRGFRLPLGRVCLSPVLRFLLSNRRHHHRDGAVKGTQRFGLRWRLLVRKFAIAVAQVSRFGDACPDVIVQIAGQVQHQMSSAIPVGIGFAPELLVRKRIHPFVQMGCNIFVICCQPRSYRFAHLCHERGPLCSHPTGYLDELQLRRVYSISQNADNSLPRAKVKASFVAHGIRGRAVRKLQRNFLIRTGFVTAPEENPSNFKRAMSLMANTRRFFRSLRAPAWNHFSNFFSTVARPLTFPQLSVEGPSVLLTL